MFSGHPPHNPAILTLVFRVSFFLLGFPESLFTILSSVHIQQFAREHHKRRVETWVQALLKTIENTHRDRVRPSESPTVVQWLAFFPFDRRFTGSNLAHDDRIFKDDKNP
jgi:hypothetical protein